MRRIGKALTALMVPAYWPALVRVVVPGIEHGPAFAGKEFATVLDVGANKGQFATFAIRRWPKARLICFEPLEAPRLRLSNLLSSRVEIHPFALGNCDGDAHMHLASREDSSSLRALGDAQKSLFSMSEQGTVEVPVRRLDHVFNAEEFAGPTLLKIDVQGFEFETLQGALGLLESIDAVYVECSFVELYAGQKLAAEVAEFLSTFGLVETGRFNLCRRQHCDVQADLLFERPQRSRP